MNEPDLHDTSAEQLAKLLSTGGPHGPIWEPDELRSILVHQLSLSPDAESTGEGVPGACESSSATQRELLGAPSPSLPLLIQMKQVAKASVQHSASSLPEEVATVLYFAALAAALVRCDRRISRLDDAGLRWGFQWALEQPWMVDDLRTLFGEACKRI